MNKIKALLIFALIIAQSLQAKSLWRDSAESFLDNKANQVGDVIKIIFNHKTVIKYQSESSANNSKSKQNVKAENPIVSFLPEIDYTDGREHSSSSSTSSSGELEGTIMTRVLEVLSNSNLSIEGTHTISVNGEKEVVSVTGIIAPKTIKKGGVVYSEDIINPTITYSGITVSTPERFNPEDILAITNFTVKTNVVNTQVEGEEVSVTNISTNEDVSYNIEDVKKRQIIIEYLNKVLDILFRY